MIVYVLKVNKQKWKLWEEYLVMEVPQDLAVSIVYNGEKLETAQVSQHNRGLVDSWILCLLTVNVEDLVTWNIPFRIHTNV